jgi:hypothetical protein
MPDARANPDRDRPHRSRAQRGDAALVARYIQELSDRHGANGTGDTGALERDPAADGGERGG